MVASGLAGRYWARAVTYAADSSVHFRSQNSPVWGSILAEAQPVALPTFWS